MWSIIINNIPTVLTALMALGVVWKYASKVLLIVKEVKELLETVLLALADERLSPEEAERIVEEAKDIVNVFKAHFGERDK